MSVTLISTVTAPAIVTAPAGPYDLTTLANVHDELNIPTGNTTNDAWLARAITQASTILNSYCNRVFQIEGLSDLIYIQQDPYPWQTPGGVAPLQLSRWPVVDVATITTTADTGAGDSVLAFTALPASVAAGQPASACNLMPGTVVSAIADTEVTLSVPASADMPAGTPVTFGLSVAQEIAIDRQQALVPGTDYALDAHTGQLVRLDPFTGVATIWEALPVTVDYFAGYATVPADVEEACLRLVTQRWFERGVNPTLREREDPRLGREVYWVGGPPKTGGLPEGITERLGKYRMPMVL